MDLKRRDYWATLTVNGKPLLLGQNRMTQGSLSSIVLEAMRSLNEERARPDSAGQVEIMLRIRNKPIATDKESVASMERATELEGLLDVNTDSTAPHLGEIYEDYYERLISSEQLPSATAELLAAEWFGREVNPETTLWLNDHKAIRFRELNSRDELYENALPSEYESLKNYVRTTYPTFVEHLTFRTA